MAKLPITVVVPHMDSRDEFYMNYCLPSIWANEPSEVLTYSGPEHVQWKRNQGARRAQEEFLFFCDDDIILGKDILRKLLRDIDGADFAYCDYLAANHPTPKFLKHTAREFDISALRRQNYISTMSLVRASAFPGFDESLERLQDWDMFLTMVENGSTGVYVKDTNFIAFWLDTGITGNDNWKSARDKVREKHGL
jgi:hypothetical protein